jgi:hypothetical protein
MKTRVWLYPGMAAWRFLSLPKTQSAKIKKLFGGDARGWGSLPVIATIGKTTWKTSIFPEKESTTYLLPLKVDVRKKENIKDGSEISFAIEIKI